MGNNVSVYVAGKPRSQPRPRPVVHCALAANRGGKKCPATIVSTMNDAVKIYRKQVMAACKEAARDPAVQELLDGKMGLRFLLILFFGTDKSERWNKAHTFVPDHDNVGKLFQDCAVDAGLITRGDGRVADARTIKMWSPTPGALVTVSPLDDGDLLDVVNLASEGGL